jgi:fatty acid-binding protein DegV
MKGLLGSILDIKPIIGVDKETGMYYQVGQARTLNKAIQRIAELVAEKAPRGRQLRVQIMHAHNPDGAAALQLQLGSRAACQFLPTGPIAPVLGAHTGAGLVGVAFAPLDLFTGAPWD